MNASSHRRGSERLPAADLVQQAAAGDRDSYSQLVRRYSRPLQRFLERRGTSPEDAEELTQETFLRAWTRLALYDRRWQFSTWIFTMAKRLAASRARPRAPLSLGDTSWMEARGEDPSAAAERDEDRRCLWTTVARTLTPEQRAVVWLRYVEDLPTPAIGVALGRRPPAVRALLFRARSALARHVG